jgi:AGCS family alanine or glycine:cation symporter
VQELSGAPPLLTGLVAAPLLWLALAGGLPRISRLCTLLVPLMTVGYLVGVALVLASHAAQVPPLLGRMVAEAFRPAALVGGAVGLTVHTAVRAAVFANEAGLGTASIAHASASPANPVRQGAIAMLGNLVSLLVCSATGLLVLASGVLEPLQGADGHVHWPLFGRGALGLQMLREAFLWGAAGSRWIVDVSLTLFAFTSLLAFGYYGERCLTFLLGGRGRRPFRLAWVGVLLVACSQSLPGLWGAAETIEALMVLPNLLALLLLSSLVFRATRRQSEAPPTHP